MYDPAIGRFTGVDPISDRFANLSTYNYASNKPINSIDLHGLQAVLSITQIGVNSRGENFKIRSQEINRPTEGNSNHLFDLYSNTEKFGTRGKLEIVENLDTGDRSESFTTSLGDKISNLVDNLTNSNKDFEGIEVLSSNNLPGNGALDVPDVEHSSVIIETGELLLPADAGGIVGDAAGAATQASRSIYYGGLTIDKASDIMKGDQSARQAVDSICNSCQGKPHGLPYRRMDKSGNPIDTIKPRNN